MPWSMIGWSGTRCSTSCRVARCASSSARRAPPHLEPGRDQRPAAAARPARARGGAAQGRRSCSGAAARRRLISPRTGAVRGRSRRHRRRRLRRGRRHPPPRARERRALPDRSLPGGHGARSELAEPGRPRHHAGRVHGLANLPEISARLIAAGLPARRQPRRSRAAPRPSRGLLGHPVGLPERVRAEALEAPVLIVIGRVVEAMAWLVADRTARRGPQRRRGHG